MAIQNFLSGGYYGKLGATVGQRWKNKRTIRTYVVPANPRTPTQQANRGKFADAVTFAQMGMQMNYYCTLFEDPNFTKWNYRMKVARELKNAGLTELDLIPLYPTSFNPPILLTEFTKATVTGQKHISFSVTSLTLNVDRVLSIMFALYNEQDVFLGYKLYLGYYYASNPGYIEVDVDDIEEVNTHCFVRIISNDDVNSATDLIGSPRLQVGDGGMDIHTFDKTIRDVQKTETGITFTFAEPWKGAPTVNEIRFNMACVVNGKNVTLNGETVALFEKNGYCAATFPFVATSNQMLPAFPVGSNISGLTVNYSGVSWQITIENATEAYSDSDLTRSISSSPTWNVQSTGDIAFAIEFGGTVPMLADNFRMVCSGRLGLRTEESQSFKVEGNGTSLIFTCVDSRKQYPMKVAGDKISITELNFVCNGVTYNLKAQDVELRNAITTSYFFEELSWSYMRDGGGSTGSPLQFLDFNTYVDGVSHSAIYETDTPAITRVEIVADQKVCIPFSAERTLEQDGTGLMIYFRDLYSESEFSGEIQDTSKVIADAAPALIVDGITYTFTVNWTRDHFPSTVGGWDM